MVEGQVIRATITLENTGVLATNVLRLLPVVTAQRDGVLVYLCVYVCVCVCVCARARHGKECVAHLAGS